MILQDKKITISEAETLMSGLERDLQAYFDVLEQAVFQEIETAIQEGKTPDELILSVENLFMPIENENVISEETFITLQKSLDKLNKVTKDLKNGKNIY